MEIVCKYARQNSNNEDSKGNVYYLFKKDKSKL